MVAAPIKYPNNAAQVREAFETARLLTGTGALALNAIPVVGTIVSAAVAATAYFVFENNDWQEIEQGTWNTVRDTNGFNWRSAHLMSRAELKRKIAGLQEEINTIIPNRNSKTADTYIGPYTFLLGEFLRIEQENYGGIQAIFGNILNSIKTPEENPGNVLLLLLITAAIVLALLKWLK